MLLLLLLNLFFPIPNPLVADGLSTPQESIVFFDPPEPPASLTDFVAEGDAAVVVLITARTNWEQASSRYPLTQYTADIVEVLKDHPRLSASTGKLQFLEIAGERRTSRGVAKSRNPPTLQTHTQAIVFLRWTPGFDHFQLQNGAHGVYVNTVAGVRAAIPHSELAKQLDGRSKGEFIRQVKAAARRQR